MKDGIHVSKNNIDEILNDFLTCKMKDTQSLKTCQYIEVKKPGDRVEVDMLEIDKKNRIIIVIDYFSRKLFAKLETSKEDFIMLNFLKIWTIIFHF